jgi:4-hydroxybenzoate polyprenyltransferase
MRPQCDHFLRTHGQRCCSTCAAPQIMRGVGCTVNDMWDHKLDSQVERSRYRPIAAGVLDLDQAMVFLAAQVGLGGIFLLQLNPFTQLLGVSSFFLAVTYPLMKRITSLVRPSTSAPNQS